jgi:hypothetical protein
MNQPIKTRDTITIPPALVPVIDRLVTEYALEHKEEPWVCRRAVEIAVIQRGVRDLQTEMTANANNALAERMGWPKGE